MVLYMCIVPDFQLQRKIKMAYDKKNNKAMTGKKAAPAKNGSGLTAKQKKLPPFIQKAILAKKKGK